LPDWNELSKGLNAILLASGGSNLMGWHENGIVAIFAWEREIIWNNATPDFVKEHKNILEKLGIPFKCMGECFRIEFTIKSAKAFQLIHILIHELGHHHDRMTTKNKNSSARGECFAERYANKYENNVLDIYRKKFNYV